MLAAGRANAPWLMRLRSRQYAGTCDRMRFLCFSKLTTFCALRAVGHSDARWVAALTEQAGAIAHTSNLFHTAPQVRLMRYYTHLLASWHV